MSRRWVSKQGYPAGGYPAPITKMGEPAGGGGIAGGTTSRLKAYREQGKGQGSEQYFGGLKSKQRKYNGRS